MSGKRCFCEFGTHCGGDGYLQCQGCGGEFCICGVCNGNGEIECPGCSDCAEDEE